MSVKPCCQEPENLEKRESEKPDLTLLVCRVCGCRHFRLRLDPGVIGMRVNPLGAPR
jgi:hypothetical protein